ncbi:MAG: MerR family transcriptional regulator [Myxococcota bacterium]
MSVKVVYDQKKFFRIGEVSEIVGVKPHVLRYWESEFKSLRPLKTRGSHRVYRRDDVDLAMSIRRLLYDEGYTILGAKRRLKELAQDGGASAPSPGAAREVALRRELLGLREQLTSLLDTIDSIVEDNEIPSSHATVHAVVPAKSVVSVLRSIKG